jgi:hypothetical protein
VLITSRALATLPAKSAGHFFVNQLILKPTSAPIQPVSIRKSEATTIRGSPFSKQAAAMQKSHFALPRQPLKPPFGREDISPRRGHMSIPPLFELFDVTVSAETSPRYSPTSRVKSQGYNRSMFRDIVCPVSAERLNKRACRVGATLTAALLVLFFLTKAWPLMVFVLLDYIVRVFTRWTAPIALFVNWALRALRISPVLMDKAPKVFAWRVGFLMAAAATAALPFGVMVSAEIALTLAAFNVLDGVFNFCVGCIIYTYFILPRMAD